MNIINARTPLGGAIYPFLERLGAPWALISYGVDEAPPDYRTQPVLRWVSDSDIHDLYVADMSTEQVLHTMGLQLLLAKGGYVLSKRLSRLMRPTFISGFFPAESVQVVYKDLDARGLKVWDGAARISRKMLLRLAEQLPHTLSNAKRRHLVYELTCAQRLEITVMSERGQDKAHAIVMNDLEADLLLPPDTKAQVRLVNGSVFLGIQPVHGAPSMRLDVQSLINLHPFFKTSDLMQWLHHEGQLFLESVRSGEVTATMGRLESATSLDEVRAWHVREYLASGGHPLHAASIARSIVNQHLKRLCYTTLGKLRLPVPGGRLYLMVDAVGEREVSPGHVTLDFDAATAWVNADDWCNFIADVLGGADQDDAVWVFPFTDFDGEHKILLWRSPNQVGEYVVLHPTEDSTVLTWETTKDPISYPPADSRQLPPRIDTIAVDYLHLVDATTAGGLGETEAYSVAAMNATVERAAANKGALGQLCNVLMLAQAIYRRLPKHPPAPLEDVIDASVKTGADLSAVREWCESACAALVQSGRPMPTVLQERLIHADDAPIVTSRNHWLDDLIAQVEAHIAWMERERETLAAQCQPPSALFATAFEDSEALRRGARFNQIYTAALTQSTHDHERARQRCEAYLREFDAPEQRALLRGALAHVHLHGGTDAAVWQLGERIENQRAPGIAQAMLAALREIGVLDELSDQNERVVRYPGASVLSTQTRIVEIRAVWWHYWRCVCRHRGEPIPERMGRVSSANADAAKAQVAHLARTQWRGLRLTTYTSYKEESVTLTRTPAGNTFGVLVDDIGADEIVLHAAWAKDGNLYALID